MSDREAVVSLDRVGSLILSMRGRRVILDSDLARLYGVTTKRLNEQVRRNFGRFPADFMFRLTVEEAEALRSQNATSKAGRGGRRYAPYAFTEHGAIMLASVLNTTRAVDVSVYVVRAFVRLREMMATNREVAMKLQELDRKVAGHDEAICSLVQAIRRLMAPPRPRRRAIGFRVEEARPRYRLRRPPQRGRRRTG
jgi:ATP-dependent Clp protease ATP-binding subunit ClpA